jgi:uncharacterized protein YndB with AHSA1/START domain
MKLVLLCLISLAAFRLNAQENERVVKAEVIVNAGIDAIWEAWTTEVGIKTFFAPAGKIELRVGGPFEMYFNPNGTPGQRGGEGNEILAIQPKKMLAFTWNAPPHLPNVRQQRTSVVVRFHEIEKGRTKVTLIESGWGEGDEWDKAFAYFSSAWQDVVFPRLKHRFEVNPIDWNNPPKFKN